MLQPGRSSRDCAEMDSAASKVCLTVEDNDLLRAFLEADRTQSDGRFGHPYGGGRETARDLMSAKTRLHRPRASEAGKGKGHEAMRIGMYVRLEFFQECTVCGASAPDVDSRPERLYELFCERGEERFRICCCCLGEVDERTAASHGYRSRWLSWLVRHPPYGLLDLPPREPGQMKP